MVKTIIYVLKQIFRKSKKGNTQVGGGVVTMIWGSIAYGAL